MKPKDKLLIYIALCFAIAFYKPYNTFAQSSSSDTYKEQLSDCHKRDLEFANKINALKAEWKAIEKDLRSGLLCSECTRSKTELDEEEGFDVHLARVKGRALPMKADKIAEKKKAHDTKIALEEDEKKSNADRCNQLQSSYQKALADEANARNEKAKQEAEQRANAEKDAAAAKQRAELAAKEAAAAKIRAEEEARKELERQIKAADEERKRKLDAQIQELSDQRQQALDNIEARQRGIADNYDNVNQKIDNLSQRANTQPSRSAQSLGQQSYGSNLFEQLTQSEYAKMAAELLEKSSNMVDQLSEYADNLLGEPLDNLRKIGTDLVESQSQYYIRKKLIPENMQAPVAMVRHAFEIAKSVKSMGFELSDELDQLLQKAIDGNMTAEEAEKTYIKMKEIILTNIPYFGKIYSSHYYYFDQ
jgi:hypothetical protein